MTSLEEMHVQCEKAEDGNVVCPHVKVHCAAGVHCDTQHEVCCIAPAYITHTECCHCKTPFTT